jgi:cytochrome c oxidase subunit 3
MTTHHAPHDHAHPAHLAHHFDTPRQQYDSAKIGMWVFLATEILMFGGLFVAYAVWRSLHPEVFLYAHTELSWKLGFINTIFLIASSLTMALAVRAAQMSNKKVLIIMLLLTLLGGVGFLCVKTVEYGSKLQHDLWVGPSNKYHPQYEGTHKPGEHHGHGDDHHAPAQTAAAAPAAAATAQATEEVAPERTILPAAALPPGGLAPEVIAPDEHHHVAKHSLSYEQLTPRTKESVHQFFQIYFLMTGLHTIHVLIGMGLMIWLLVKALKNTFSSAFFTPVDIVGLYWHLVDLIWIFLFPLLYLIH